jgi:hypothetical protein
MSASRTVVRAVPCGVLLAFVWVSTAQAVRAIQVGEAGRSSTTTAASTAATTTPATTTAMTTSSLSPPQYRASVYGTVRLVQPHLPGKAPPSRVDAGAAVTVVVATRHARVRRTTLTGSSGSYRFANLPACSPAAGDTCTVSVAAPGGAIGDMSSMSLPGRPGSTRVDLMAGRLSQRFFIAGTVLPPGARSSLTDPLTGSARPASDLTVWVQRGNQLEEIYDGLRACRTGRWTASTGKPCSSTAGNYLLGKVALPGTAGVLAAVGHSQAKVMLILLEAKRPGGRYVPVDSVTLHLPANTASNNANPPLTVAPTLHEVAPVPAVWSGHIVGGRVTKTANRPTNARAPAVVGVSRARVMLIVQTGKHVSRRRTQADRSGYYAFTNAPNCSLELSCTVALLGGKHNAIEQRQRVTVPSRSPSVTVIDLKAPPTTS